MSAALERGRAAFAERDWAEAFSQLAAADREEPLEAADLRILGQASHLSGHPEEWEQASSRAYQRFVEDGDVPGALRVAFHLVMGLGERGDFAQAQGWLGRARGVAEQSGVDCAERGLLMLPAALQTMGAGDPESAFAIFEEAGGIGDRYRDADLSTLSRLGRGRCLVDLGRTSEGMAFMDEAMLAVLQSEASPIIGGIVYCATIETCRLIFDLRRAREWTASLTRWCASQPGLMPFRGPCMVSRAEIMRWQGEWPDALEEAARACELLEGAPDLGAAASAYYEQGELCRLRGELEQAEDAYRQVVRHGESPQPGLARLQLGRGDVAAAEEAMRVALGEARGPVAESRLLPAFVEVMLATGHPAEAREAAARLAGLAEQSEVPLLVAAALCAEGAVLLEEGDAAAAVDKLKEAWLAFREVDTPYEAARARVLLARAHRAAGNENTARMELDAARWAFEQLGAAPDVAEVDALMANRRPKAPGGLTGRELEVLGLIAAGLTNKAIAGELFLSEKTVARHVSNIFVKLDVTSRSAATAFAFQNELVT